MYRLVLNKLQIYQTQSSDANVTEAVEFSILNKMMKELEEEKENYLKVNNTDQANNISLQMNVISELMPKATSEEDINDAIDEYIKKSGAYTQKQMGIVMKYLKDKFPTLDGKVASNLVKAKMTSI